MLMSMPKSAQNNIVVLHTLYGFPELKETLIKYVLSGCNPSRTLQGLFIHKNTLYARLKKIEKILNCSLDSNDDLLNIQLVIKADQLHIFEKE